VLAIGALTVARMNFPVPSRLEEERTAPAGGFSRSYWLYMVLLAGMVFWGMRYATQDTLFKAVVAGVLPEGTRNLAFGLFYSGYGAGWLIGSVATGLLYEPSRVALVAFAVLAQLISLPLFVIAKRQEHSPQ
jgi:MFS family permease